MFSNEIGNVLFSTRVIENMKLDPIFCALVGRAIGKHFRGEIQQEESHITNCGHISAMTQFDKNGFPRTTIALRKELGK